MRELSIPLCEATGEQHVCGGSCWWVVVGPDGNFIHSQVIVSRRSGVAYTTDGGHLGPLSGELEAE